MVVEEELCQVVISGVSGKYPRCENVEELKEHLLANEFLVTDDDCRWNREIWKNVPAATGKISVVKKIDDTFFGIFSGVAAMLDPLTRVTIERAFEAIMDAGLNPKSLRNCKTAVYTASGTSDSEAVGCDEKLIAKFWLVAHAKSLLANRISYVLNLTGPSWTIDSSWNGGIQCLKQAFNDIRRGRVESALVGVTNVILFPDMSQHWNGLGKLSADGTCFPFQEDANGYARSESTVFLFLQRENEAKRIYAKLNNVDTMFCGEESETLLKPKEEAFVKFLRSFYEDVHVVGKPVAFVEADGSADKHLDRIELSSIDRVLCAEKNNKNLHVGCVKSNLGHAEAASSYVSISKALIALDSEVIPPSRTCQPGSKKLKMSDSLNIVTKPTSFPEGKYAAVNTIGVGASIGHVLLEQHHKRKKPRKIENLPKLVLVSARHELGLFGIIDRLESMPYDDEYFALVNDLFTESMHGYFYRGFTILGASEKKLHFTLETGTPPKRPIWFVFAGMGSQWPGMGADLMNIPIFAAAIKEIDAYLAPLGIDIVNVITSYDPIVLMDLVNCFVGIVAVQIGMIDVLKALGIEPDGMFGHSLGENMCAYADGCFTKYQAIMAAYYRGKASIDIPVAKGLMASVGLNYKNLPNLPPNVEIACHNSEDNVTISGPYDDVQQYISELEKQKIFVRVVKSNNVAYHSKQVQPLATYVLENIRKVVPNPVKRSSKWISTSVPEKDWDLPLAQTSSAEYHVNNFKNTVYFAEACTHIPEDACIIEISPHGLFQGLLKRMISGSCFVVPLGKRETSNALHFMLSAIGKLFVVGLQPDINAIYPKVEYPVSRGTPSLAALATWNHETEWEINIYPRYDAGMKSLNVSLREPKWRFLTGYKINERILMPFTKLLIETLRAYDTKEPILVFENIIVPDHVEITASETATIYTQVQYGSGNFEITTDKSVLLNGVLRYSHESLPDLYLSSSDDEDTVDSDTLGYEFTKAEVKNLLQQFSINISEELLLINEITFTDDGFVATITWNKDLADFISSLTLLKVFWDLCLTNHGPLLTSKFSRFAIETEKYNSMPAGSRVTIHYYKSVNMFVGPGVQLCGLENSDKISSFPAKEQDVVLRDTKFVCHENPQTKTLENFFVLCAQLIGETFNSEMNNGKYDRSTTVKIVLASEFDKDTDFQKRTSILFESLYQELSTVQIIAKYVKAEDLEKMQSGDNTLYFIISNGDPAYANQVTKLAKWVKKIFLLTMDETPPIEDFVKVVEEKIEKFDAVLWKKKEPKVENIIHMKRFNNEDWVEVLEGKIMKYPSSSDSIIVQWHSEYISDIVDAILHIKKIKSAHSIRYVITTDADMEENGKLNLNSPDHRAHLEKGLVMNVMQGHKWGSIRQLIPQSASYGSTSAPFFPLHHENFKNIHVEYVATYDETSRTRVNARKKVKAFDFSGTATTDGKKLMGIAFSENDWQNPDVYSTWQIPEQWSLENAVTVPLAYLKAYYSLTIKGRISHHSTVLVHNAYSVLGEALIAVALTLECTVYAAVADSLQAKYLKQRFRYSSFLVVLNSGTVQIDVEILKRTHKLGVDIIVNAETEKQLHLSTVCLKKKGTLIVLSEIPLQTANQIGMEMFLRSTTLYSVLGEKIMNCGSDVKSKFQKWLNEYSRNGIVRPFNHVVVHGSNYDVSKKLTNEDSRIQRTIVKQDVHLNGKQIFTCDPEKIYLIIGPKNDVWFAIVTSLIENHAKKLAFIDEDTDAYDNQYMKRFNLYMENRTDLSLMYVSAIALQSREEAAIMIEEMNAFAELDLIFCISLNSKKCELIDHGVRLHAKQIRQLVCFQCDASVVCESRIRASQPALNIVWDRSTSATAAQIGNIKKCVEKATNIDSPLCHIAPKTNFSERFQNSLMNKDSQFFPHYSEAEQFAKSFSASDIDVSFEKHVSKCPSYSTRTQLFPVFILPGLHSRRLKPLIENLMYPVFCAKYPVTLTSANSIAKSLIEPLKKIQPKGPYTIVGESWSGVIAIELVSLLEKSDPEVQVNLILLEGLPKNMQNRLSSLGLFGSPEFISNLYETCFRNLKMEKMKSNGTKQTLDKERATFLELLERKLMVTKNYSSEKAFLRNKVIAMNLEEKSILDTYIDFEEQYGQNLELKTLNEDNYEELLRSKTTARLINDNVLFKW